MEREREWLIVPLEQRTAALKPVCSTEGCVNVATRIIGFYENQTAQGVYSQFRGWFYCTAHAMGGGEKKRSSQKQQKQQKQQKPLPRPDELDDTRY